MYKNIVGLKKLKKIIEKIKIKNKKKKGRRKNKGKLHRPAKAQCKVRGLQQ